MAPPIFTTRRKTKPASSLSRPLSTLPTEKENYVATKSLELAVVHAYKQLAAKKPSGESLAVASQDPLPNGDDGDEQKSEDSLSSEEASVTPCPSSAPTHSGGGSPSPPNHSSPPIQTDSPSLRRRISRHRWLHIPRPQLRSAATLLNRRKTSLARRAECPSLPAQHPRPHLLLRPKPRLHPRLDPRLQPHRYPLTPR